MSDYNLAPIPRFPLPDDWEPAGTRCIQLTIPDDPQYLAILLGHLERLTWSNMYARDATKTGAATVARTWENALNATLIEECGDMSYDTRVKPGFWWMQQASTDGGLTWHDSAIFPRPCGCDDDGSPFPQDVPGPGDLGATILRGWYMTLIRIMWQCKLSACSKPDFVSLVTAAFTASGVPVTPTVTAAIEDVYDAGNVVATATLDSLANGECNWQQQNKCFSDLLESTDWKDFLNDLSSNLVCAANGLASDLVDALNSLAEAIGGEDFGDFLHDNGGGGGGAGFGDTGGCSYLLIYAGFDMHAVAAGAPRLCRQYECDVPSGYILSGMYFEYQVNITGSGTNPGLFRHSSPDCQAVPGQTELWSSTSFAFSASFNKQGLRYSGEPAGIYTSVGLDMTGAAPEDVPTLAAGTRTGPRTVEGALQWRPSSSVTGDSVDASVSVWFILRKL